MNQTLHQGLHQQLVELRGRAEAWLAEGYAEGFIPKFGICHHLKINPDERTHLTDLLATWPAGTGCGDHPVPHPTEEAERAYDDATAPEMWEPQYEYARARWALLEWLIEQTAPRLPYVVVIGPGTALEQMIGEFATISEALACAKHNRGWYDADVMKRRPDGSLTTEF